MKEILFCQILSITQCAIYKIAITKLVFTSTLILYTVDHHIPFITLEELSFF